MITTFWQLLKTDLMLFSHTIKDKFINLVIWTASTTIVSSYILQAFGVSSEYGAFQAGGTIIAAMGFELYPQLFSMTGDIFGPKYINYQLILPTSNAIVLLEKVVFFAINGLFMSATMLPLIKLLLLGKLSLSGIDYLRFFITLVITSIFFGFFTIFLTSLISSVETIENVMMRILFPIWFFGCFQYSLKIANSISPVLAGISVISPYSFACEALRSAMLGPEKYIPFFVSIGVLCAMTLFVGIAGYYGLRKKLDFI